MGVIYKNGVKYSGSGGGGGVSNLYQLSDVTISSPAEGQGLVYDDTSGKWMNNAEEASENQIDTELEDAWRAAYNENPPSTT